MPPFVYECLCGNIFSDKEKAFNHAADRIDEETSVFAIVRHIRESKEAMKLLLSKKQRRLIRKSCEKITVTADGFEDSDQSDGRPEELIGGGENVGTIEKVSD